nr:acylneuraminate cytidylyltransferase family protein [uncultured Romboutsia sp.]
MDSKVLAIIPARSGSKGIIDKNIINLNGKPLIAYSIDASLGSKYIDKVVVTTDCEEIANVAREYGAEVPFLRPHDLASDTAKTIDVVIHCIEEMKKLGEEYDYMVLLQPTQPLRQSWHIDEAIELILEKSEEALVSISKVKDHPILMRTIDKNGHAVNLLEGSSTKRRQDFQDFYKVNGAIYINKINENLHNETSLNDNKLVYIMDKKYDVDIDEMLDLQIAEILISECIE